MEGINRHRRASEAHDNPKCPIYRPLLLVVQNHSPKEHIIYIETEFSEPRHPRYMRQKMAAAVAMGLAKMCSHWEKTRLEVMPRERRS